MYGSHKLSNSNILRYGLTKEFFQMFSSLQHHDIELPLVLGRDFQNYLRDFVGHKHLDEIYVENIKEKHQLYTAKDAQQSLCLNPVIKKDLSTDKTRTTILLHEIFEKFAIDQLKNYQEIILLSVTNKLEKNNLPDNIKVFNFYEEVKGTPICRNTINQITYEVNEITKGSSNTDLFNDSFRKYFIRKFIYAYKVVETLEKLLTKYKIGLMIDHIEIVNPGTTLALLGKKYNLPFINCPQYLSTDRSFIPTRASHYALWGKYYSDWLKKRDICSKNIKEVGNITFFYQEKKYNESTKKDIKSILKIPNDHIVIAYTTQPFPFPNYQEEIINWIKKSILNLPITLIIKEHPADNYDYMEYFQDYNNIFSLPKDIHLYDLFQNCDFTMTISSTSAIEAALFNNGLIVLQPQFPFHYEYNNNNINKYLANCGAGYVVKDETDLKLFLSKVCLFSNYRNFIKRKGQNFLKNTLATGSPPKLLKDYIEIIERNRFATHSSNLKLCHFFKIPRTIIKILKKYAAQRLVKNKFH